MSHRHTALAWAVSMALVAGATACQGAAAKAAGPCADLARALRDRPASELNTLAAPANTESFQRELGLRTRSSDGASNTHRPDGPLTAIELYAGARNKPEADLVFLAYADGTMRYVGCADVTTAKPARLAITDTRPGTDAVLLADPVWIGGRPYNKPSVLDYIAVGASEPPTGRFFGGRPGDLPPLLAPVVSDAKLDIQKLKGECGTKCLDFGLLVAELTGSRDGRVHVTLARSSVNPATRQADFPVDLATQPAGTVRLAIAFSGYGQNLYPQQDWHVAEQP